MSIHVFTVTLEYEDMPDRMTPQQRHNCMSHIRSRNTKPEVLLRKELHRLGYRFRINVRKLPGTPDIVLAKYRTCIFVNGCFWHGHQGCSKFVMPKTRTEFWSAKIARNRERDLESVSMLESGDWKVITIWECELAGHAIDGTVSRVCSALEQNRIGYEEYMEDRKRRRKEWQEEIRKRKIREQEIIQEMINGTCLN